MRDTGKKVSSQRRGSALFLVLLALVILLVLGNGLLSLGLESRIFAIRTAQQIAARCAADAGLMKAIFEMNEKLHVQPWDDSLLPQATNEALPNSDAVFSYAVTGDTAGGYTVESIGRFGPAEKRVVATLRLRGLFDLGLLVKETVTLYSNTLVDGYHSSDSSQTDVLVEVATVSTDPDSITLKHGASVDGDILIGVDVDFPEVFPPSFSNTGQDIYVKGTTLTIGPQQSGKYTNITLLQGGGLADPNAPAIPGILEIDGGDVVLHVTGDIWLGHACEMSIKPGSSLAIYLDGDFISGNSGGINNETQIPSSFALYGTGDEQKIELKAKGDWYGVVYAPEADVTIKAKTDIYGSFVATKFDSKSSGFVWYDAALRDVGLDDVGVRFTIKRWHEE